MEDFSMYILYWYCYTIIDSIKAYMNSYKYTCTTGDGSHIFSSEHLSKTGY